MKWQPIETAPTDGRAVVARIPGYGDDNLIAWRDGFLDAAEQDCCGWVFVSDQEPPPCWTDGACWESNENDEASIYPTHWMSIAEF